MAIEDNKYNTLLKLSHAISVLARHRNLENKAFWQDVKQNVLDAANVLRVETGQVTPPIILKPIAKLRLIQRVTYFPHADSPEATLVPAWGGFIVRLRPGMPRVRYRYSLAHEIGHTLFYDIASTRPIRLLSQNSVKGYYLREEAICKGFANQLLMPLDMVSLKLDSTKSTMEGLAQIKYLARLFEVSFKTMALRLIWDIEDYKNTVMLFRNFSNYDLNHRSKVRRIWGRKIRNPRKAEKELINRITRVMEDGYWDTILNLAQDLKVEYEKHNRQKIKLEYEYFSRKAVPQAVILLNFS
ncbi:ImmA/IrrE family metallo-endopeptidase [Candidatus Neomarinimicrobiota bacterium]